MYITSDVFELFIFGLICTNDDGYSNGCLIVWMVFLVFYDFVAVIISRLL